MKNILIAALLPAILSAADRPNVLIILADDLGYSDLSCYGSEIQTPHIDRLANHGAKFESFYNSARCCPSRASLFTGLHPHEAGIGSFATAKPARGLGPSHTGHLLPNTATLAEILGDAGYSTWMIGKWHMGNPGPIERGIQNYYGYGNTLAYAEDQWDPTKYVRLPEGTPEEIKIPRGEYFATDVFTEYALEFLKQARARKDQPWMLFLSHSSPHFPVQAPKESIDRHFPIYQRGWDALRAERFERQKNMGLVAQDAELPPRSEVPVDRDDIANGYSGKPNPAWDSLPADRQNDLARRMATFAAMVEHLDQGVGRILMDLEEHGELENTIILFTSDNGACYEWGPFGFDGHSRAGKTILRTGDKLAEVGQDGTHQSYGSAWANLGNTPMSMYKHFCHEGGIASPMVIHWLRGFTAHKDFIREPGHLMDIVPTLCDATGSSYPQKRQGIEIQPVSGVSLLPVLRDGEIEPRSLAFEHQGARGLRDGDWKIVWGKRQPDEVRWELYNLKADRFEQNDLAKQKPELLQGLVAQWENWAKDVGAVPFAKDSEEATPPEKASSSSRDDTPKVANRPLELIGEANSKNPEGVLLAVGGNRHGFALHFIEGRPAFDVRIDGKVTRLLSEEKPTGWIHLRAKLDGENMTLAINRGEPVSIKSPGLIPEEPIDALSVGFDDRTAAGDYTAPNPFNDMLVAARVITDGSREKVAPVMERSTIEAGLKSHDRALLVTNDWIRDPYITPGPDGFYYLTGTTPNGGDPREVNDPFNTGLGNQSLVGWECRIWRSKDFIDWESMDAPFTLKDGIWPKVRADAFRKTPQSDWRLWAPELHWLGDRWALIHTSPSPVAGANLSLSAGPDVRGPWTNPMGADIAQRHDPSLFKDDDGTWWIIWGATRIAPLKPDFSGLSGKAITIAPSGANSPMGHEGCLIMKIEGKYVLFGTGWSTGRMRKGSYNLYYATADQITGPYGERKFAGRFLGHGTPFTDKQGRWWCTAFYNANVVPVGKDQISTRDLSSTAQTINQRGTTLVPLDIRLMDGDLNIRAKDPDYAIPGPDEAQKFDLEH